MFNINITNNIVLTASAVIAIAALLSFFFGIFLLIQYGLKYVFTGLAFLSLSVFLVTILYFANQISADVSRYQRQTQKTDDTGWKAAAVLSFLMLLLCGLLAKVVDFASK